MLPCLLPCFSVLRPSSCAFATRRRPRSSSHQARWSSRVRSLKTTRVSRLGSTLASYRNSASTPSFPSLRYRILSAAVTSNSRSAWRVLRTVTDSLAVMSQRYVILALCCCMVLTNLLQLFPGLIYRMIKPKVVLLIFVSGKIVLTGAKVNACFLLSFYWRSPHWMSS